MGMLEPEKLSVAIKNTNDITQRVSVDLQAYSIEPMLIWITSQYDETTDKTTLTLDVHQNLRNYFY